jgi:tRNA (guanosine-2'-O-)-methyltransferase
MTPERFQRLKHALLRRQYDLTVLADGVHKDHNISAVIRTCDAVGIATLHAVSPGGEVRRHHMVAGGSRRWVDVELHESTAEAYRALRDTDFQILAAHAGADAIDFREADFTRPTAVVLGSELEGPTPYAVGHADASVSIPMYGLVESLNVSVAAAVILFEAERQRASEGLYSRPPPDPAAFEKTLFEWAYPEIARRCREQGLDYPGLSEEGELTSNPFSDSYSR